MRERIASSVTADAVPDFPGGSQWMRKNSLPPGEGGCPKGRRMRDMKTQRQLAQELRRNATREENHLWYDFLKNYPVQFRRQKPLGPYIVDFYCDKAALVVELDGGQHYEETGRAYDRVRTEFLSEQYGLKVIRFSNLDVKQNFEGVCMAIDRWVRERIPSSVTADAVPASPGGSQKEHPMKTVTLYTDGACSGNPGPGGWGANAPQKAKPFAGDPK